MHDILLNYLLSLLSDGTYAEVHLRGNETLKVRTESGDWTDTGEVAGADELDSLVDHLRSRQTGPGSADSFQFSDEGTVFDVAVTADGVSIVPLKSADAERRPTVEAPPRPPTPPVTARPPIATPASRPAPVMPATRAAAGGDYPAGPGTPPALPGPGILKIKPSILSALSAVMGGLGGLLLVKRLYAAWPPPHPIGRICDLAHIEGLVTLGVAALFVWSLLLCLVRFLTVQRMSSMSKVSLIKRSAQLLASEGLDAQAEALQDPRHQYSPLIRRLGSVTRQWQLKPGLQEASLVLQEHTASDEESAQGVYSLVRAFVWALPVLGLIGTVIGIGSAVGNFAQFLGGKVDDVSAIKQSLIGVTSNLSFAFYITLEGLLTSLVVMLIASALESRETHFIQRLGQNVTELFMPWLQRIAPERSGVALSGGDASALKDTLQRVGEEVLRSFGTQVRDEKRQASEDLARWTDAVRDELAAAANSAAGALRQAGAEHQSAFEQVSAGLSSLVTALAAHHSMLAGQAESARQITDGTGHVAATLAKSMAPIAQLEQALSAFAGGETQRALAQMGATIAEGSKVSAQSMEALKQMSAQTRQLIEAQSQLQAAVAAFTNSGFSDSLAALRQTLDQMAGALESFRQPFVLQAVPSTPPRR